MPAWHNQYSYSLSSELTVTSRRCSVSDGNSTALQTHTLGTAKASPREKRRVERSHRRCYPYQSQPGTRLKARAARYAEPLHKGGCCAGLGPWDICGRVVGIGLVCVPPLPLARHLLRHPCCSSEEGRNATRARLRHKPSPAVLGRQIIVIARPAHSARRTSIGTRGEESGVRCS
jgi:hypothetical protein